MKGFKLYRFVEELLNSSFNAFLLGRLVRIGCVCHYLCYFQAAILALHWHVLVKQVLLGLNVFKNGFGSLDTIQHWHLDVHEYESVNSVFAVTVFLVGFLKQVHCLLAIDSSVDFNMEMLLNCIFEG